MGFQVKCPKCGANVEVYQERLGWGPKDSERVLHCQTCGKVLYGKEVDAELQRQHEARPKPQGQPKPPPALRPVIDLGYLRRMQQDLHNLVIEGEAKTATVVSLRDQVVNLGVRGSDSEPARMLNLLTINSHKVTRLLDDLRQAEVRVRGTRSPPWLKRLLEDAQAKVTEIQRAAAESESWAARAVLAHEKAQQEALLQATAPAAPAAPGICAFVKCKEPAAPGRVYCGDDCRKRQARWTSSENW